MMTRRKFLAGSAAATASAALATIPAAGQGLVIGVDIAAGPDRTAFAVGTPGELDWTSVFASSPEEAYAMWKFERHGPDVVVDCDPLPVIRVPAWDRLPEVGDADWINAGFGASCHRCDYTTCLDEGGRIVGSAVVCEACLTLAELIAVDRDGAIEDIAAEIACDGEAVARSRYERRDEWDAVAPIWPLAIAMAEGMDE